MTASTSRLGISGLTCIGSRYPTSETVLAVLVLLVGGIFAFLLLIAKNGGGALWAARPKGMRALVRKESELALLGLWLLCPLPLPCALSKLLGSMDLIRCIISAAPALCILLAVAAVTVRDVTPELVILGLVVVLTAALLRQYYVDIVNEKWHEAAPYIERKASPGDAVVVTDSSLGRRAFAWYYDWSYQRM